MIARKSDVMNNMGCKSACCLGGRDLGMGMMLVCFHCCGMVEIEKISNEFKKDWGNQTEEPGWKAIKTCGCRA